MSLEVRNLSFSYKSYLALNNVSFGCNKGEIVALLGTNGAGKSTLLKCICGLLKPQSGHILFNSSNIKPKDAQKLISYFSQSAYMPALSVFESVLLARKPFVRYRFSRTDYATVQSIIEKLNLNALALRPLSSLSGGQVQLVRIASMLSQGSKILLIDEPLNNLDIKHQVEVIGILKSLVKEEGLVCLIAIHDLNIALNFADRFLFLKNGEVASYCDIGAIDEKLIEHVFGLKVALENFNNQLFCLPVM